MPDTSNDLRQRSVQVDDERWEKARDIADDMGISISAVVRFAIDGMNRNWTPRGSFQEEGR